MKQREYDLLLGSMREGTASSRLEELCFIIIRDNQLAPQVLDSALRNIIKAYNKKKSKQADKGAQRAFPLCLISAHIYCGTHSAPERRKVVWMSNLQYIARTCGHSMTMERYNHVDEVRVQNEIGDKTEGIVKIG